MNKITAVLFLAVFGLSHQTLREKMDGEIVIEDLTSSNEDILSDLKKAVDLDLGTFATAGVSDTSSIDSWIKVNLGKMHCITQIRTYREENLIDNYDDYMCEKSRGCTCSAIDCSEPAYIADVTTDVADHVDPECEGELGDVVEVKLINNGNRVKVFELVVIGRISEMKGDDKEENNKGENEEYSAAVLHSVSATLVIGLLAALFL